ncbi:fumarylacetoacetase [Crocinitomicaceae bacterium]|nr:fumarylacetoacetase [Crocinitomicaceae bacterium]MDC1282644.1 fumarylacetoacetase [Crocinitomicaceae bacterium]|tara:strand:+ start:3844 stop:5112 length:1269 start_codon:yes stop_codon:yes gene_type:complete
MKANDPTLKSWVEVPANSDFPIQNLPFGIGSSADGDARVVSRIGDMVIDLRALWLLGYFEDLDFTMKDFDSTTLNEMMRKGKQGTRSLRNRLSDLFSSDNTEISANTEHIPQILLEIDIVTLLIPVRIGDYTDFYSSEQHAYNVGCMFRDPDNALMPNWKHLPVGYHGRASSIVVSGTPMHRPKGQQKINDDEPPVFGPCRLLDFELEMTFVTYEGKPLGDSISTKEADDYIFGMALFNDWSARDIQKWEYIPLGPFLAKSFATHVAPWIVTLDALEPFRVAGPVQDPKVLPYLEYSGNKHIDINLQVAIQPENSTEKVVTNSNYKHMYWNMNQQLAHHTSNGCNINAGDMMASGTISGPEEGQYGSMLEVSWKGTKPVSMPDGTERRFINDHDTVIMRGYSEKDNVRVGFGEVSVKVLPAK